MYVKTFQNVLHNYTKKLSEDMYKFIKDWVTEKSLFLQMGKWEEIEIIFRLRMWYSASHRMNL